MKLFASDFDGTFYFWNRNKIFKENIKAVKEFQKENKFAIVTGRSPQSILKNLNGELKPDYIAGFNGGIVCDSKMNVLYEDKLEIDVHKIMNILSKEKVKSFSFISEGYMFAKFYSCGIFDVIFMYHYANMNERKVTYHLDKVMNKNISMATIVCKDIINAKLICEKINDLNLKCNAYVNNNCIDIVDVDSSKKKAVEIIEKHMDADEVYVIGDSYNDLPMIEYYHGFTLEHAHEDIKKIARYVVKSVADAIDQIK